MIVYSFERKKIINQRGLDIGNNYRFRPFDLGIKRNFLIYLKQTISKEKRGIDWEEIYYENLKDVRDKANCCEKNCCEKKAIDEVKIYNV
jgi:hypothetical protein